MVFAERLTPILLLMMGRKQRMRAIARSSVLLETHPPLVFCL
jgi:hypothetical protein